MLRSEQLLPNLLKKVEGELSKMHYVNVLMCMDCHWIGKIFNEAQNW